MFSCRFPEVLLIDGTYRVNRSRFPLYTIMVCDGNGQGQAVAHALLADEKRDTLRALFTVFRPSVGDQVKTVVTDKDFNEIDVVQELWPEANLVLCRFHVLKAFRQKISDLSCTADVKDHVREIVKRLVYAASEEQYNTWKEELLQKAPGEFIDYFQKNWDDCKERWTLSHTKQYTSYGTYTTNFVESRHQKLKETMKPSHTLAECVRQVIAFQNDRESLSQAANLKQILKGQYVIGENDVKTVMRSVLTPHGVERVCKELDAARKISGHVVAEDGGDGIICLKEPDGTEHLVHLDERQPRCSCAFTKQMELPCRHIFMAQSARGETLFREEWVPLRWRQDHQVQQEASASAKLAAVTKWIKQTPGPIPGKKEKYNELLRILKGLADLCSDMGEEQYRGCFRLLQNLIEFWSAGRSVVLVVSVFFFNKIQTWIMLKFGCNIPLTQDLHQVCFLGSKK